MAKLTDAETRTILGPDYVAPAVTPESLAAEAAARRRARRNTAVTLGLLVVVVLLAVFFKTGG